MSIDTDNIKILLFDLGGVLVELDDISKMWGRFADDFDSKELWRRWLKNPSIQAIDRGQMSVDDFLKQWVQDWNIDLPYGQLKKIYEGLIRQPYPGAQELLADCQKKFTLGCLSNMTEGHWPKVKSFGLTSYFEHIFVSYQMGYCKPEDKAYELALEGCSVEASEVLFIDDNEINVMAARERGIQAIEAKTVEGARKVLENLNLL